MLDATENELMSLQSRSRIAVTANNLTNLSPEERTLWAIEVKDQANELFKRGLFAEAASQYLEVHDSIVLLLFLIIFIRPPRQAIAATRLDDSDEGGNVDEIVVPLLCNIAACNIQMKVYK